MLAHTASERFTERMLALVSMLAANLLSDRMSAFPSNRPRSKLPIVVSSS